MSISPEVGVEAGAADEGLQGRLRRRDDRGRLWLPGEQRRSHKSAL
jgi:hypothetical protein